MVSKAANTLSPGAVAAAKVAGRFYKGRVYGSKAQKEQAQRDGAGGGGSASGSKRRGGTVARPVSAAGAGKRRETTEIVLAYTHNVTTTAPGFKAWKIMGARADVIPELVALISRHPKILGARLEVGFTAITNSFGRWAVAVTHKLSSGTKSVPVVASVSKAKAFHDTLAASTWVALQDVAFVPLKEDEAGNSLLTDSEQRHVVVAVESTSTVTVTAKLHLTVQVDVAGTGSTIVDI